MGEQRRLHQRQRPLPVLFATLSTFILLAGGPRTAASAFAASPSSPLLTATRSTSTTTSIEMSAGAEAAVGQAAPVTATTLGSATLRSLVQDAAFADRKNSVDLGGVVWLEHLNLVVGDMDLGFKFYVDFLGLSRDGNPKHVNLGRQQFHLSAKDGEPPQRVTGSIGLTVPSLARIRERAVKASEELKGTSFAIDDDEGGSTMTVTCPWGNVFHLYDISVDDDRLCTDGTTDGSSAKMVKMHGEGGAHGAHRMAVLGGPGMRYVEFACKPGTVAPVAEFYEEALGCAVTRAKGDGGADVAVVAVGPGVHMAFVESAHLSEESIERMEGVHACIYIPDFKGMYESLSERKLIWTNPRFTHLDSCDTWEEARDSRTLRFKDVVNVKTGEKLLELEHETRPMTHGQYMKAPPYVEN